MHSEIADFLREGRDRIKQGWCQVDAALDEYDDDVSPYSPAAVCWCLTGAMSRARLAMERRGFPTYVTWTIYSGAAYVLADAVKRVARREEWTEPQTDLETREEALNPVVGSSTIEVEDWLAQFNDDPERTQDHVLQVFDEAINIHQIRKETDETEEDDPRGGRPA